MTGNPFLSLVLFAAGTLSILAESAEFSCYYRDNRYKFTITEEQQDKCPKWDSGREENPPLSPAQALKQAKKYIARIETAKDYAWEFEELSLLDVSGWLWRTRYRLTFRGGWTGPPVYMDCYILMDGTVIKPVVTPHRRDASSAPIKGQ
jgi:hypothetical protein